MLSPYEDPVSAMELGLAGMAAEIGVAPHEINAQWRDEVTPKHSTNTESEQ